MCIVRMRAISNLVQISNFKFNRCRKGQGSECINLCQVLKLTYYNYNYVVVKPVGFQVSYNQ